MTPLDIDRMSDWAHAVQQWQRGDARPVAVFVLRYGAQTDDERREVARMLTSKPDARRDRREHTEFMLRYVERAMSHRQRDRAHMRDWVARLHVKLTARGWTAAQIASALGRRHYLRPKGPTNDDIFAAAASHWRVSVDAVEKARKRTRR